VYGATPNASNVAALTVLLHVVRPVSHCHDFILGVGNTDETFGRDPAGEFCRFSKHRFPLAEGSAKDLKAYAARGIGQECLLGMAVDIEYQVGTDAARELAHACTQALPLA
jgi:hypothetical protein